MNLADVAAIIAALAALASVCQAYFNRRAIHEVHLHLNSRLDQLLKSEFLRAHALGREEKRLEDSTSSSIGK